MNEDAEFIKTIHSQLRQDFLDQNDDENRICELWSKHLDNQNLLDDYAKRMKRLAEGKWQQRLATCGVSDTPDRIEWIIRHLRHFFDDHDWTRIETKLERKSGRGRFDEHPKFNNKNELGSILDVGSCFAPFHDMPGYQTLSIDLAPASEKVKKCDFLNVSLENKGQQEPVINFNEVVSLPRNHFEVVIFCLLLEYLPLPQMRHDACQKAHDILKPNGILFVVTPDSSHQGKNLNQMRSWNIALNLMGFFRVYYEKLEHLTCLGFMKVEPKYLDLCHSEAKRLADKMQLDLCKSCPRKELLFIPQDRNTSQLENEPSLNADNYDSEEIKELFDFLPSAL